MDHQSGSLVCGYRFLSGWLVEFRRLPVGSAGMEVFIQWRCRYYVCVCLLGGRLIKGKCRGSGLRDVGTS